jgi:hypothetical protein
MNWDISVNFEFIFGNNLGSESEDQVDYFDEGVGGRLLSFVFAAR